MTPGDQPTSPAAVGGAEVDSLHVLEISFLDSGSPLPSEKPQGVAWTWSLPDTLHVLDSLDKADPSPLQGWRIQIYFGNLQDARAVAETPDRVITHQVGKAHSRELFKALGLDLEKDYTTFETLGNVGSVSCPITLARAIEEGAFIAGQKTALLGIGSGLSSLMMAVEWPQHD